MTHWERVRAAIKGEEVDRVPISLWKHWPVDDVTPAGLAAVTLSWQREFDFDLVKFMPTGTYGIEDWGGFKWSLKQNWSTTNTASITFDTPGRFFVSAHLSETDEWAFGDPQTGLAVEVASGQ